MVPVVANKVPKLPSTSQGFRSSLFQGWRQNFRGSQNFFRNRGFRGDSRHSVPAQPLYREQPMRDYSQDSHYTQQQAQFPYIHHPQEYVIAQLYVNAQPIQQGLHAFQGPPPQHQSGSSFPAPSNRGGPNNRSLNSSRGQR